MKKAIIALAMVLIVPLFAGACSAGHRYTDEEAAQILEDLVSRSKAFNEIFWGDAPELEDPEAEPLKTVSSAQYYRVSKDFPYRSVKELKEAASEVFSEKYLSEISAMAFDGHEFSDNEKTYRINPRYSDDSDGYLCYDITSSVHFDVSVDMDYSTVKIVSSSDSYIKASVSYVKKDSEGEMTVALKKESGVWKLDGPSY